MAQIPLSEQETSEVLSAGPEGILIGGMALAFWTSFFGLKLPFALESGVTYDVDFLDTTANAQSFARRLGSTIQAKSIQVLTPNHDDATPNSAKILIYGLNKRAEAIEIDFLRAIHGFTYAQECRLRKRAPRIEIGSLLVSVMSPMDVLASRVFNCSLPSKRNSRRTIEQVRLAIEVVRAYITSLADPNATDFRQASKVIEEIAKLATTKVGIDIHLQHQIDLLTAIPNALIQNGDFQDKRWPQICDEVRKRRDVQRSRQRINKPDPKLE